MSPLVWDLAHVANYEELWLLRAVAGVPALRPELDDVYDAFRHPRRERVELSLLGPAEARVYASDIRARVLDLTDGLDLTADAPSPLLAHAFVQGMVIQHEHQHDETMLATLQLMEGRGYRPDAPDPPSAVAVVEGRVLIPDGPFVMGTDDDPWALDNERPAHIVDVPAYWIGAAPVTNREFSEFILDGGYDRPGWWSEAGWAWRQEAGLEHPEFWQRDGSSGWLRTRFGWVEPVPADEPVQHVCWYEADAYARWAGGRLPTEAEWEKAAAGLPGAAGANLGQRLFRPAPVGAYPAGQSRWGVHQMIGDVWEWTASDFAPYPGFASFPYREYSEVFFGSEYKVLRGGSWATHPVVIRPTFRNWDYPIRRQIFAGFRCTWDT